MSVATECALVEQVIPRARSLVSPHSSVPPEIPTEDIGHAAQRAARNVEITDDSSGALISAYASFAILTAKSLGLAERTDGELQGQMTTAAALTRSGAARLDVIADHTRATREAGASAIRRSREL
jgi:hypothetical protein